jgi:hypothetical protein
MKGRRLTTCPLAQNTSLVKISIEGARLKEF